ncbi:MAG: HTH domain-containing protein, partial [Thermoplasmata archaeon]|nr:HTH domain-containing protein [Thermoplasmata archaeon]
DDTDGAGTSAADWLKGKKGRLELMEVLKDGRWHNAAAIGEILGLSVVSVQRRVAALRDRGLVESHRRRGYRLTEVGFEALGLMPKTDEDPASESVTPAVFSPSVVPATSPMPGEPVRQTFIEPERKVEPIPSDLLEWLGAKPYRKDLIMAIPPDDYISSSELSEILNTSVTAIHGRLNTMKVRELVTSLPRRGYMLTPLGQRASEVLQVMAMRKHPEPEGASAFLSAEPEGWTGGPVVMTSQETVRTTPASARSRKRLGSTEACGFCNADASSSSRPGWTISMQANLEDRESESSKVDPIPCHRGVMEDAFWFLVVDRNPLAEGHCKLICKEHVTDLMELSEWSHTDQRLAQIRDIMTRDLMLAVDIISKLDDRIIDVMVMTGLEQGSHLHFELIPRYRMDLPGLRPLAAAKGHYDDLSLTRKRKLWQSRCGHLEEVADRLRTIARGAFIAQGQSGLYVTEV